MDSTTLAVIVGAISTALAGLGGWFGKQGMATYLQYKDDKRKDIALEDAREDHDDEKDDTNMRFIIGRQDGELASLRGEIKEMRESHRKELSSVYDAHNECEKRFAKLETEFRVRMEFMGERCDRIETAAKVAAEKAAADKPSDSKVLLEFHTGQLIMPDGTALDPNNPKDAEKIARAKKRLADMANDLPKDETPPAS